MPKIVQRMMHNLKVVCPMHAANHGAHGKACENADVGSPVTTTSQGAIPGSAEMLSEPSSSDSDSEGTFEQTETGTFEQTETVGDATVEPGTASSEEDAAIIAASSSEDAALSSSTAHEDYCTWTGSYGDLLAKHLAVCPFIEIDCPHGCGQRFRRGELSAHGESCEKGFEECTICKQMVKIRCGRSVGRAMNLGMAQHRTEAAETHVKILEARVSDLQKLCERFRDEFRTDMRFLKQGVLAAAHNIPRRTEWKIKTSELFETCTKGKGGDYLESSEFTFDFENSFRLGLRTWAAFEGESESYVGVHVRQTKRRVCHPGRFVFELAAEKGEFARVVGNEEEALSWQQVFDTCGRSDGINIVGEDGLIRADDLRKASEIVVTLRPLDSQDDGRVVVVGRAEAEVEDRRLLKEVASRVESIGTDIIVVAVGVGSFIVIVLLWWLVRWWWW